MIYIIGLGPNNSSNIKENIKIGDEVKSVLPKIKKYLKNKIRKWFLCQQFLKR